MTKRTKLMVKWGMVGPIVAMLGFLISQGVVVLPWHVVTKDELRAHEEKVEERLDSMSSDIHLIMGALGVRKSKP